MKLLRCLLLLLIAPDDQARNAPTEFVARVANAADILDALLSELILLSNTAPSIP